MSDDQRTFLLQEFETFVERCKVDFGKTARWGDGHRLSIEQGTLVVEWLRGDRPPTPPMPWSTGSRSRRSRGGQASHGTRSGRRSAPKGRRNEDNPPVDDSYGPKRRRLLVDRLDSAPFSSVLVKEKLVETRARWPEGWSRAATEERG